MSYDKDSGASPSMSENLLQQKEKSEEQLGFSPLNPLDHLAFAIMADAGASLSEIHAVLARIKTEFVDWNETRLARRDEMTRLLTDIPNGEKVAKSILTAYNAFFEARGSLTFDFLAVDKSSEARKLLQQAMPALKKGGVALLLYEFCPGSSMPLSDGGLQQARKDGLVAKGGDRAQAQKRLHAELTPAQAARLLQYWEIEAVGHPYGEMEKPAPAKSTSGKAKAKKR